MELIDIIRDKTVALIGNGSYDITVDDRFDVLVRMNDPFVWNTTVGRTDVLCTSVNVEKNIMRKLNPKYIIWMSSYRERASKYMRGIITSYYPLDLWEKLFKALGHRPSNGCMTIDYFSRIAVDWDYFGFDFYKDLKNRTIVNKCPHNYEIEKEYIDGLK